MDTPRLADRQRAQTFSIEDLVADMRAGRIRIPAFQRPFRWGARQVEELFDSIWRGFPIGNLLFWERDAPEEQLRVGPLHIAAPAQSQAWLVVDGQQRMTTLAAVLLHPSPTVSSADIHALWFDLEQERFVRPGAGGAIGDSWLPMNRILDAVELGIWFNENPRLSGKADLYRTALTLSRRIREYKVPAYLVESASDEALRMIFTRLNTSGVAMRETEVFTALHASDRHQSPLAVLRQTVQESGMGGIDDRWLLRVLRTLADDDLSRKMSRQLGAYADRTAPAVAALSSALDFLRLDAAVPHLKLLPYGFALLVLARVFHLHPEPDPRSRVLLRRWFWRGIVTQRHKDTSNPHLSSLNQVVDQDLHASIQRLLQDVGEVDHQLLSDVAQDLAQSDRGSNSAATKIQGLILAHQGPVELLHQPPGPIDVPLLLSQAGMAALVKLPEHGRILHRPEPAKVLLEALHGADGATLRSHAWLPDPENCEFIRTILFEAFLQLQCEPGASDHPTLSAAMAELGEE